MSILINSHTKVICQDLTAMQTGACVDVFQICDLIELHHSSTQVLCNCGDFS